MVCSHLTAADKVWFPRLDNHITTPHPYCKKCGTVKNVSGNKANRLGFYISILNEISRYSTRKGGKLAKVQIRLIAKKLEKNKTFEDSYGMDGTAQKSAFVSIVMEYTNLSPTTINSIL